MMFPSTFGQKMFPCPLSVPASRRFNRRFLPDSARQHHKSCLRRGDAKESSVQPQRRTKALIRYLPTRTTKRSRSWFSPRAADQHGRRVSAQGRLPRQLHYQKNYSSSSTTLLFRRSPGSGMHWEFQIGKIPHRNSKPLFCSCGTACTPAGPCLGK